MRVGRRREPAGCRPPAGSRLRNGHEALGP